MVGSFSVLSAAGKKFPALDNVATWGYIGSMREVGIRELKNRLSEYVRLVREGETVMVTDRGQVVAELRPPEPDSELARKYPKLVEMARRGLVRLPLQPNGPDAYPRLPPLASPVSSAEILDWLRGDR
jgi:antitoxin (DNA-binding transcriptional repressor) of toxin-antitoxin stability system